MRVRVPPSALFLRGVAQLVERAVWDREAGGSNPLTPTKREVFTSQKDAFRMSPSARSAAKLFLYSAESCRKKESAKIFKELFYKNNGRPGCTHTLSDLSETVIKKSESQFEHNYNLSHCIAGKSAILFRDNK